MAKGAQSKTEVFEKLLTIFPDSFMYNGGKELRIPLVEDGAPIQLKVTLTCAKDLVSPGGDTAMPGDTFVSAADNTSTIDNEAVKLTEEEKEKAKNLMKELGL